MAATMIKSEPSLPLTVNRSQLARALGYESISGHINWVAFYNYIESVIGEDWKHQLNVSDRQHIFNAVQTRKLITLLELKAENF